MTATIYYMSLTAAAAAAAVLVRWRPSHATYCSDRMPVGPTVTMTVMMMTLMYYNNIL